MKIHRIWDEALWRTSHQRPLDAAVALISWTPPSAIDSGRPPYIEPMIATLCVANGPVAFRLFFDGNLSPMATIVRARRKRFPFSVWERVSQRWGADVVIATTAGDAREMFDQHWSMQGQAAFIFEHGADTRHAIEILSRTRDWKSQRLPAGVSLLLSPAVDGDGILLAAKDDITLETAVAGIDAWCGAANVPLEYAAPARIP
ncbi:hypothetical protein [Dyella tabacisoli]|uniref:hypothetical protein n=1 Tax=Dyella tabacisoli TaxID=2282381 RepID=UPI0013B38783|nr:hypothetical protein [Dyella tabacisoli]